MKRLLIPLFLALIGTGAGIGAGLALAPPPGDCAAAQGEDCAGADDHADEGEGSVEDDGSAEFDYVRFSNQFVVPVVRADNIQSLVVMSLTLEVELGANEQIFTLEPKLRDQMLRVLFDHANAGGFDGQYTSTGSMETLTRSLLEAARAVAGGVVRDILVADIVRQDF